MNIEAALDKFKNLYSNNRLSHFYVLRFDNYSQLENLQEKLIYKITNKELNSHPDFFKVEIDDNEKSYKVDSKNIQLFLKFIGQNPINIQHRFVIFEDGHKMSDVLLNKLLKTLEELNSKITIILLVPKSEHLLPTIKSRSIEIYLGRTSTNKVSEMDQTQILSNLKKGHITLTDVIDAHIDNHNFNFQEATKLINALKSASRFQKFNNQEAVLLELIMP